MRSTSHLDEDDTTCTYLVVWKTTNALTRWPCIVCGGVTDKDALIAVAFEAGAEQTISNELGMVCHPCAFAGQAEVSARLIAQAESLEKRATVAREDAAATWQFPSAEDWRRAIDEVSPGWFEGARREYHGGHDPLPSFLSAHWDATPEDLGPGRHSSYDTCYPGCPACASGGAA